MLDTKVSEEMFSLLTLVIKIISCMFLIILIYFVHQFTVNTMLSNPEVTSLCISIYMPSAILPPFSARGEARQ
jgi:TRAP-type C4-dicarboxylate transport system permease small subunit